MTVKELKRFIGNRIVKIPPGPIEQSSAWIDGYKTCQNDILDLLSESEDVEDFIINEEIFNYIYNEIIKYGQHDTNFKLGETILYTPDEYISILRKVFIKDIKD